MTARLPQKEQFGLTNQIQRAVVCSYRLPTTDYRRH
ncbi:MAG: hypothetical protein HY319_26355 [Armatimonadetes bacterium]|nr:hypothetical protein [Armatimonadota bacterium]